MDRFWSIVITSIKFRMRKIIVELLFNIIFTILMWLGIFLSLDKIFPNTNFIEARNFLFPGIIAFYSIMISFALTSVHIRKITQLTGLMDQCRSTGFALWQIYLAKSTSMIIRIMIHIIISSIVLLILVGGGFSILYILLFWIYLGFGIFFLIQIGFVAGIYIADQEICLLLILSLILPLTIVSGSFFSIDFFHPVITKILYYFPTTVIISGARNLLVNHSFDLFHSLYILGLDITCYFLCYWVVKRKLLQ